MLGKRAVERGDRLAVSQARISSAPRTRDAHARARKFSVALDVPPSDSDDRHGVKRPTFMVRKRRLRSDCKVCLRQRVLR